MAERDDRNTWTDERLNDLAQRVDTGFKELRADMRAQGAEINQRLTAQGAEINQRFTAQSAEINERFAAQDKKMDRMFESMHHDMVAMHRTMLIGIATILASTVGAVVGSNVFLG